MMALARLAIRSLAAVAIAAPLTAMAQDGGAKTVVSPDMNAMTLAQPWTVLETVPPPIRNMAIVNAPIDKAWKAWTDPQAMSGFLGFSADLDPRPGGKFQVVFAPKAATPIQRGNDGRYIAIEPMRMLSVSWMTPMNMPELTGNSTTLTLYFTPIDGGKRTQIDLINVGYGTGPAWRAAYDYNVKGWERVLSHLQQALEVGPLDWDQRAEQLRRNHTLPYWRENKRKIANGQDPAPPKSPTSINTE